MNQSGGLQRVVGALAAHVATGHTAKLPVDQRNQSLEGFLLALAPGQK